MLDGGQEVDLLITDLVMPGMTGLELVKLVRMRHPELPVLYISGYSDGMLDPGGEELGSFEVLAKPFTPSELRDRVALMLAGASSPAL